MKRQKSFSKKHKPSSPKKVEYLVIGGEKIKIGPDAVPTSHAGTASEEMFRVLQEAIDKGIFKEPELHD